MTDEVEKLGRLLTMGTEDIYLPAYMVPVFNLGTRLTQNGPTFETCAACWSFATCAPSLCMG